jgi:hypothetical protein
VNTKQLAVRYVGDTTQLTKSLSGVDQAHQKFTKTLNWDERVAC